MPVLTRVKVHRDFHVEVARALGAGAPARAAPGRPRRLELVKLFAGGVLVKTHPRQRPGARCTDRGDLPAEKAGYAMRDLSTLVAVCTGHGPNVGIYAERLLDDPLPKTPIRAVYWNCRAHFPVGLASAATVCRTCLASNGAGSQSGGLMRTSRLGAALSTATVLLLLAAAPAYAEVVVLTGSGSGADEVPGPGEEGATIEGDVTIDTDTGVITYTVSVAGNSEDVAAAHIHEAPAGVAGPVAVPLDTAAVVAGTSATTTVDPALAAEIAASPENYYLNAHSATFPAGFARGQLDDTAPSSVPAGDGSSAAGTPVLVAAGLLVVGVGVGAVGMARRRGAAG